MNSIIEKIDFICVQKDLNKPRVEINEVTGEILIHNYYPY